MKKIVIDPITRIEGHLRAEIEIDENNIVQEAYISGQLFRGIETILKNRDPRDAGLLAGRICGVCTNSHFRAAITAVEDAYALELPKNAQIIRDLISLALFLQDHVVHFYHLHLLDYVDVTDALEADPKQTSKLGHQFSERPYANSHAHYISVKEKLQKFVKAGKLGLFANGYWGHKAYKLSPEENLLLLSHYLEALKFQTNISQAIAIFGGKTPHPQTIVVGGITSVADMLNPQRLNDFIFIMKEAKAFIDRAYLPDMKLLVRGYKEEIKQGLGKSAGNFLSVGGYQFDKNHRLFEPGVIFGGDFTAIHPFDARQITENVERAWYDGDDICYTDLNPDGTLKTAGNRDKYSWIKAPRYAQKSMECGPLARILVSYYQGNELIKPFVDSFLKETDLTMEDLHTTIGRNAARAIETAYIAEYLFRFINTLVENIKYYDTATWKQYQFDTLPGESGGKAFLEVPRGVLSHFVEIKNQKIDKYQVIAPTTWNASPKDSSGQRGAYEEALIGLTLQDSQKPLEVLRVLHAFDPCIACAVHVIDAKGKEVGKFKIEQNCLL